jgi:mono/diheme cytochrome c family protein
MVTGAILCATPLLRAADAPPAEAKLDPAAVEFFEKQVKPLLTDNCLKCHGPEKHKGELRLDSGAGLLAGGDQGAVVTPGDPEKSLLIKAVRYGDDKLQMPPKKRLAPEQVETLVKWIKMGAPYPGSPDAAPVTAPVKRGKTITDADRHYWAYQPVQRPEVPAVKNKAWVTNPIDAFVLAKLEAVGLKPAKPAEKVALLRRVYYDLIGLPPTPAEVEAFANDKSPDAYEKLIDHLLQTPQYGEKWGRHWLDVVRYAESNGYERDGYKPNVWRYRDYVVRSFNSDKPYDRFIREQLAGDEIDPNDADCLIATGFYRLGLWDDEPADRDQARFEILDDIVSTTSQAFLAMTVNCARCHDHKVDPILQADYYKLLSFFQNISGSPMDERPIFTGNGNKAEFEKLVRERQQRANELQKQVTQTQADFAKLYVEASQQAVRQKDIEGLKYRFYRDSFQKLPDFSLHKPESEGELPKGLFDIAPRTRDGDFAFVFEGALIVPKDGTYTFYLDSDDGSKLVIDNTEVLDYDGVHGTGNEHHADFNLKAGRLPVRLEFFQGCCGLGLSVAWSGPDMPRRSLSAGAVGAPTDMAKAMESEGEHVLGKERYAQYQQLKKELDEASKPLTADKALTVAELNGYAGDTWIQVRGNAHARGEMVKPGFPTVLGSPDPAVPQGRDEMKTAGRRKVLADWIASPMNPLTARVMANRIWQHHFGHGIVRSSNDFGGLGEKPENQQLLDWLAAEFVGSGWRIKAMHRLIMTSSTYRMSSSDDKAALAKDPENHLMWRYDMRRLTAEEIRDSMLAVNGTLNLKMGGPSIFTEISDEVKATSSQPANAWGKSTPEDEVRRSIYITIRRSVLEPMLSAFDLADTDASCPVRFATTVPTQALSMLNSDHVNKQAAAFAARLKKEAGDEPATQVALALRLVLCRAPQPAEIARGVAMIKKLQTTDGLPPDKALQTFCLMALNLNEFVYLD